MIEHNKLKELGNKTQIFSTEIEKECACPGNVSGSTPKAVHVFTVCADTTSWLYIGKNLDKERI